MSRINTFLLENQLRIDTNPCISPDFCLDWPALAQVLKTGTNGITVYDHSGFDTFHGSWQLVEGPHGDCAWLLRTAAPKNLPPLENGIGLPDGRHAFPSTWQNLLLLKNIIQEHDPKSTIFPSAEGSLGKRSLGVGARFTALHWPAVEWIMAQLDLPLTANQNSIPRELVFDTDVMLDGGLDAVPFPFIGTSVPEGHQGQSVEGMSHGCVLSKLRHGFHHRRIPWSFNADHQPIGGKFDAREAALVRGCLLASYITFDLSPELADGSPAQPSDLDAGIVGRVRKRVAATGVTLEEEAFTALLLKVWPAMHKLKRRDSLYAAARASAFSTSVGRDYLRELSIDELPGITTPATTAVMLALCEAMEIKIHFIAPALGFQKNIPYPDQEALRQLVASQWDICRQFDVSIGFHSGSGKSAENYRLLGEITGQRLEIKTSGRYTYEMGRALHASSDPRDQALWLDWYRFTRDLALTGAFAADPTEQNMARSFISDAIIHYNAAPPTGDLFTDPAYTRQLLEALTPSPDHMFWFEYNFLYVLAAGGRAEKSALGDHSPAGYGQRARFYAISDEARLLFAKNIALYLLFLAETTGLSSVEKLSRARLKLEKTRTLSDFLSAIAP